MAQTPALEDISPFIDPLLMQQFSNQIPSYGSTNLPTTGGPTPGSKSSKPGMPASGSLTDILSSGDPLFGMLFGGDKKPGFKPYQDANGQWVFAPADSRNPVPVSTVPGAALTPNKSARKAADSVQAITNLLPYFNQATNANIGPQAQAQFDASAQTSPEYAQLMTQLYNQYGPQLNAIGNEIARRNALSQAQTENQVLTGPGTDLVKNAYNLQQTFDKPYYDTRAAGAKSIQDLIGSIDLSGGLSPTERDEINKQLALENYKRGTINAPSQTDVVSNAMRFGQAGHARQQEAKSNLSDAIQKAAAFLPAAKSGVDVFQTATGRSSTPNSGNSLFPGINNTSGNTSQGAQLGSQLFGGINSLQQSQMTIDSQKKDWLDQFNQFTSGLGNLTGLVGQGAKIAGVCWVAREVYGFENPKWLEFRKWLIQKSPLWLFRLYMTYGESFAKFIRNRPTLKLIIKGLMDYAISHQTNHNRKGI